MLHTKAAQCNATQYSVLQCTAVYVKHTHSTKGMKKTHVHTHELMPDQHVMRCQRLIHCYVSVTTITWTGRDGKDLNGDKECN